MSDDEAMRREPSGRFSRGELGGATKRPHDTLKQGFVKKNSAVWFCIVDATA